MDTIRVTNPILVAQVLMESFREMGTAEFERTFADIVRRGDQFSKLDDSKYSATLTEAEATMYACHARQFIEALNQLKDAPHYQSILGPRLANTIALWQVVSTFKTLHGGSSSTEE